MLQNSRFSKTNAFALLAGLVVAQTYIPASAQLGQSELITPAGASLPVPHLKFSKRAIKKYFPAGGGTSDCTSSPGIHSSELISPGSSSYPYESSTPVFMNGDQNTVLSGGVSQNGGMSNGMSNGMMNNSMSNGMSNGITNNGMSNGMMMNGMSNGMMNNGMSNGMMNNGMSNGMMNNGMSNGMMNNGMSNGMMMNGMSNGMMNNGMSNGMSNGMMNGMSNGVMNNGMSNGMMNNGMSNGTMGLAGLGAAPGSSNVAANPMDGLGKAIGAASALGLIGGGGMSSLGSTLHGMGFDTQFHGRAMGAPYGGYTASNGHLVNAGGPLGGGDAGGGDMVYSTGGGGGTIGSIGRTVGNAVNRNIDYAANVGTRRLVNRLLYH